MRKAQQRVEIGNCETRKNVMECDDVMRQQRQVIYEQRRRILEGEDMKDQIIRMVDERINHAMNTYADEKLYPEEWNLAGLIKYCEKYFLVPGEITVEQIEDMSREEIQKLLVKTAHDTYESREKSIGSELMREMEKAVMPKVVAAQWMERLDNMGMLKGGI